MKTSQWTQPWCTFKAPQPPRPGWPWRLPAAPADGAESAWDRRRGGTKLAGRLQRGALAAVKGKAMTYPKFEIGRWEPPKNWQTFNRRMIYQETFFGGGTMLDFWAPTRIWGCLFHRRTCAPSRIWMSFGSADGSRFGTQGKRSTMVTFIEFYRPLQWFLPTAKIPAVQLQFDQMAVISWRVNSMDDWWWLVMVDDGWWWFDWTSPFTVDPSWFLDTFGYFWISFGYLQILWVYRCI